jgi:hypothetical protein
MCLCHSSNLSLAAIAATIGIIVAIFAALFGLIWFPVKIRLKSNSENTIKILKFKII